MSLPDSRRSCTTPRHRVALVCHRSGTAEPQKCHLSYIHLIINKILPVVELQQKRQSFIDFHFQCQTFELPFLVHQCFLAKEHFRSQILIKSSHSMNLKLVRNIRVSFAIVPNGLNNIEAQFNVDKCIRASK